MHAEIKELEYTYITDGIYAGSNQCCQSHFDETLLKEGITADISLEDERIDAPFGVEFYIWLPVKKGEAPDSEKLAFIVEVLEKFVGMGKKVYIHCQNGHGRTSTVMGAYLVKNGYSIEDALRFLQSKRPSVHLNNDQRQSIEKYLKKVRQTLL